jgi:uncharacterized protein (TIGR03083 family)
VQITPRYDQVPLIVIDGDASAIARPMLRQRRRVAGLVAAFTTDDWSTPSRCDGWRVQDVIAHLTTVDQFWNISITSGLRGEPTRFLEQFDPKATPAAMVEAARDASVNETRDRYLAACDALGATVESMTTDQWRATGEAPVGHVGLDVVAHHALWDCWVHERDMLLPLGVSPVLETDEVVASLRYAAALGPAFAHLAGAIGESLVVAASNPTDTFTVAITDQVVVRSGSHHSLPRVAGDAVALLEALSVRSAWPADIHTEQVNLLRGLDAVFETSV